PTERLRRSRIWGHEQDGIGSGASTWLERREGNIDGQVLVRSGTSPLTGENLNPPADPEACVVKPV
ncbi:hypothetical protein ACQKI5_28305, partial [Agrobacterium tumefaciens]|uniref:hypothetical protein n=1 Tax=Agrobacterium tumefaciens TaxID=358 RepID=UPI003D017586